MRPADLPEKWYDPTAEGRADPLSEAIGRYMQEQGDESRMPVFDPRALVPRGEIYPQSETDVPPMSMSPNDMKDYLDEVVDKGVMRDDFIRELVGRLLFDPTPYEQFKFYPGMSNEFPPYYGGEGVQRRFFPKR